MHSFRHEGSKLIVSVHCFPLSILPCENLVPTLPTAQLDCRHLGPIFVCVILVSANVASSRDEHKTPSPTTNTPWGDSSDINSTYNLFHICSIALPRSCKHTSMCTIWWVPRYQTDDSTEPPNKPFFSYSSLVMHFCRHLMLTVVRLH